MAQTATGVTYCITRYPVVVHIVDPNVIDRTCCKLLIRQQVPAELVERLGCSRLYAVHGGPIRAGRPDDSSCLNWA